MAKSKRVVSKPKVRILKLVSGQSVIATIITDGNQYSLNKPLEIMSMAHPENPTKTLIMLSDFIAGSKQEDIRIGKQNVMCTVEPDEGMANLYEQMTTPQSDIVTPPEKKLLLPE